MLGAVKSGRCAPIINDSAVAQFPTSIC
jgi:hypothetical protein